MCDNSFDNGEIGETLFRHLIPHATNAEQAAPTVEEVVRPLVVVEHILKKSVVTTVLRATPPIAAIADNAEAAIGLAKAARQG